MNRYQNAVIVSTKKLAEGIFQTVLSAEEIAKASLPGQFVCVYSDDGAHLLPRPISICDTDPAEGTIRLVYRVVGFGTDELSKKQAGATAKILGPIGTGYESVKEGAEKPLRIVIGGGIGIPPMLLLAKEWSKAGYEVHAVLGYRNNELFLLEDLSKYAKCHIAAEGLLDGDAASRAVLAACGPMPMLQGIAKLAEEKDTPAYISLEERMACGVGACLGCIVKSREVDAHSHVKNKRICTEGPVFAVKDLCL